MFERFSDRARRVMQFANEEAQKFNHEYIGTEHIALGLLRVQGGRGYIALLKMGVDTCTLRHQIEGGLNTARGQVIMGKLPQTPRGKKVIEYAMEEARKMNHNYIGTEHLLLGLIVEVCKAQAEDSAIEKGGIGGQALLESGVTLDAARDVVRQLCSNKSTSEVFEQERNQNICAVQNLLWNVLQLLDIVINGLDRQVFDEAYDESDWNPDRQRDRALDPAFQPEIKMYRDAMMVKRNSVACMLGMEERRPHDLEPRDYQRREEKWAVECPLKIRT